VPFANHPLREKRTPHPLKGKGYFPRCQAPALERPQWESKLELLHRCVPKLELGNKGKGMLELENTVQRKRRGPVFASCFEAGAGL
jgi:hypothetical protein